RRTLSLHDALPIFDEAGDAAGELVAHFRRVGEDSVRARLRDRETGIAAGVDRREGSEVHVHVERDAVIAAPAPHPEPERRDLRALDVYARCPGPALGSDAESR